jgi:HB1, ASXL, restriction endonuclease HTH domain
VQEQTISMTLTYVEAAVLVLRSAQQPLTAREITILAIQQGLIAPRGKTPEQTMSARLYMRARIDPELVKLESPGSTRAKRGSVRWTLRSSAPKHNPNG